MAKPTVLRGVPQGVLTPERGLRLKAELVQLCHRFPEAEADILPELQVVVDRSTTGRRTEFWQMNAMELADVSALQATRSKRLRVSVKVWEACLRHLDTRSGAITLDRKSIAEACGQPVNLVSAALKEFVSWRVLLVDGSGGTTRWRLNPNIGTRLSGVARDAARDGAQLVVKLVVSNGDRIDDPQQEELEDHL